MSLISKLRTIASSVVNTITSVLNMTNKIKSMGFTNWSYTTNLASDQQTKTSLYRENKGISNFELCKMKSDPWILAAEKVAPNNLVIRQFALIDIFNNFPTNKSRIQTLLDTLSYKSTVDQYRIWAEGYSYWEYTKIILNDWIAKFALVTDMTYINSVVSKIDQGFVITAYLRGTVWYPAPFGDLRDEPLNSSLQQAHTISSITIANVTLTKSGNSISYSITGRPIGLNTHIPVNSYISTIINEVPNNFKFYTGYSAKYKSLSEELADTFNSNRLKTVSL